MKHCSVLEHGADDKKLTFVILAVFLVAGFSAAPKFLLIETENPVLKIAAHGAHMRGTKASLGGPKIWWTRKLVSFES